MVEVRDQTLREYLINLEELTLPMMYQETKHYVTHHSSVLQMGGHLLTSGNVDEVRARFTTTLPKVQMDSK